MYLFLISVYAIYSLTYLLTYLLTYFLISVYALSFHANFCSCNWGSSSQVANLYFISNSATCSHQWQVLAYISKSIWNLLVPISHSMQGCPLASHNTNLIFALLANIIVPDRYHMICIFVFFVKSSNKSIYSIQLLSCHGVVK